MSKSMKTGFLFYIGAATYITIEVLWRSYSHWTMGLIGGLCFILIGAINIFLPWEMGIVWQSLIAAAIVTVLELVAGLIINNWLGLGVWDYSTVPFNIAGQICLGYSLLWIPLSIIAILLDDWVRYWLFKEEKPHYKLF